MFEEHGFFHLKSTNQIFFEMFDEASAADICERFEQWEEWDVSWQNGPFCEQPRSFKPKDYKNEEKECLKCPELRDVLI